MVANVFPDRVSQPKIEAAEVHADDGVRFALEGQFVKLGAETAKRGQILDHFPKAGDGVSSQVKSNVHSRRSHAWPAGPEEARFQAGVERLIITSKDRFTGGELLAQGMDQLRRKQIATCLASDEHEGLVSHTPRLSNQRLRGSKGRDLVRDFKSKVQRSLGGLAADNRCLICPDALDEMLQLQFKWLLFGNGNRFADDLLAAELADNRGVLRV